MRFAIVYPARVIEGEVQADWDAAPDDGVQGVVRFDGHGNSTARPDGSRVDDRSIWTGDENYDPFGWGPKRGAWVDDDEYWRLFMVMCDGID